MYSYSVIYSASPRRSFFLEVKPDNFARWAFAEPTGYKTPYIPGVIHKFYVCSSSQRVDIQAISYRGNSGQLLSLATLSVIRHERHAYSSTSSFHRKRASPTGRFQLGLSQHGTRRTSSAPAGGGESTHSSIAEVIRSQTVVIKPCIPYQSRVGRVKIGA